MPGTVSGDGEEIDAYVIGVEEALDGSSLSMERQMQNATPHTNPLPARRGNEISQDQFHISKCFSIYYKIKKVKGNFMKKINVKGVEIVVVTEGEQDYISLTDMLRAKDGDFFIF